ncbi:MAG: hypothetical protein JWQ39_2604 [Glaciihabitans sp.]|nr:hypothetical protein [Glaciihabitans sp.]
MSTPDDSETRVRIRRAPKFSVFLIVGGAVGVIVAFILTAVFPVDDKVSFGQAFGYVAIYGVTIGVLIAAVIAVILDRVLSRRAKTVSATVDRLRPVDDDGQLRPEDDEPS